MKLLYLLLFLPLVSFCSKKGSETSRNDSISFQFREKEIRMDVNNPNFEITATLRNSSKEKFILYAFRRTTVTVSAYDSIFFAELPGRIGAGNALFVLDKDGNRQQIVIDDCDDCDETDKKVYQSDFLANAKEEIKNLYLETTEVLSKGSREVNLKIAFEPNQLKKGEYQFYMIYYCGINIEKIIGDSSVKNNVIKNKVTTFKGWVKSNCIRLIVE